MSEITIQDASSNHKYRTEIPNILYEIGLKPIQFAVYCAVKRSSGEHSSCTKSYDSIALHAGCSRRTAIDTIDSLCEINPYLKKPLISKEVRMSQHGDNDTNNISINDIWPENFQYFIKGGAKSAPPSAKSAPQGVVQNLHPGGAKSAPKEEPFKKNSIVMSVKEDDIHNLFFRTKSLEKPIESMELQKIYLELGKENFTKEEILEAVNIFKKQDKAITPGCLLKYLKGIINNLRLKVTQTETKPKEKYYARKREPKRQPEATGTTINWEPS